VKETHKGSRNWTKAKVIKVIIAIVVIFVVYVFGVNVGDGQISLSGFSSENNNLPTSLDYSSVNQVYSLIKNNYDGKLTTNQVLDGIKTGLANSTGDPYTEYFNPSQAQQFNNELSESFSGIGAELGENSQNQIIIISPIAGFPAAQAGLKAQDVIAKINGQSTTGMTIDQAVDDIRGPQGTQVTLDILRNGTQQLTLKITRSNITVPSVTNSIIDGNIGYMQISQFTNDTAGLALQGATEFSKDHVKGIILDLRDNPGGLVNQAVSVSSLWLPAGKTVLQEKRGSTVIQTYSSSGDDILKGIPTVVLINGGTASASEITSGALHDNGEAELIGVKSFGKGVVQQLFNLTGGGELKVTIASWYRPDGQNINKIGITPDEVVQMPNTQNGSDPQKAAAVTWIDQH